MIKPGGVIAVVGAQFGDEGKGRFIDNLIETEKVAVVARYNGGSNAGHRIVYKGSSISLHLVPSGIFHDNVLNVIGNGAVVNPLKLAQEIAELKTVDRKIDKNVLKISDAAQLVMPSHIIEDMATGGRIDTTRQGIGPAYMAKVGRYGLRTSSLRDPKTYKREVQTDLVRALEVHGRTAQEWLGIPGKDYIEQAYQAAELLKDLLDDTGALLRARLTEGQRILAEGAQSTLLDINHGTYPFVTSSSTTSAGVAPGLGIPPATVTDVFGVAKLTMSRVGEGPFPTEIHDEDLADKMRGEKGAVDGEYGGTTGRSRRIGWFDAVAVRYSMEINGITRLGLTKLDRLSSYPELKIATAYVYKGEKLSGFTTDVEVLANCEVAYEVLPGWSEDLSATRNFDELPTNAKNYIKRVEELTGATVAMIGVGPNREQIITKPA